MSTAWPCHIRPELHPGYRLHRLLGRGGFGEVWAGETNDGRPIALKFLPCASDLHAVNELRSIQIVRSLNHPNLIGIDRVWSSPGFLVVAMELADGSLLDLLDVYQTELGRAIPSRHLGPLMAQAAEALDFLNARQHPYQGQRVGIQHCDVSPTNLLLFGETVKLSDFSLTSPLTATFKAHRRAGTPAYAAPEVFQGKLSERTDQYALAVTYCLLRGGRLPFSETPAELQQGYVRPTPDLSMLKAPERPVIARALAVVPEERWPSCKEMVAELNRATNPPSSDSCVSCSMERRDTPRCRPSPDTTCQILGTFSKSGGQPCIQDLSAGGIRLRIASPLTVPEVGRKLSVVLFNRPRGIGRVLRLRIAYAAPLPGGDYELGGAFDTRLKDEDLNALLEDNPARP